MAVQMLLVQLRLSSHVIRRNIGDFSQEESTRPGPGGSSSANWILGHIISSRLGLMKLFGAEPDSWTEQHGAVYRRGSTPDPATALPVGDLLAKLDDSAKNFTDLLENKPESWWNELVDGGGLPMLGEKTPRTAIAQFLLWHESYHAGQLGTLRRAVGKPGAIA